jgi:predicted transposase/invertase (TIGR01784 family)
MPFSRKHSRRPKLQNMEQLNSISTKTSLKSYRDLKGVIDTAFDEGKLEGKLEIAKNAKEIGLKIDDIVKLTGLTKEEIEKL